MRLLLPAALLAGGVVLVAGFVFAGSANRIPEGVQVAGVDVGGLTAEEARARLSHLGARYRPVPVVFTAEGNRWAIPPERLDVRANWNAAVEQALGEGDSPLPLRGLERLKVRLFGVNVEPPTTAYEPGLEHELDRIAAAVERPPREAAVKLRGLRPVVVPGRHGAELDRRRAAQVAVAALAGFERAAVPLPVRRQEPEVTAADLAPVAGRVRTILSRPVELAYRGGRWRVGAADLAPMLALPADGGSELGLGGRDARRWWKNLARGLRREPRSADFRVRADGSVRIVPSRHGRELDVAKSTDALLAAASRPRNRTARLVVAADEPRLTTREAHGLGVERRLASYATLYAGTADRIHNLQQAVARLDGALVAPGATFSFNERVGPRTEERGYRLAPVILGGEYEEGIGGGVSQVATTVFNAAWEAGLRLTERNPHALYIDRYPLGRDATVNYPDLDLKFVNDTGRWLVLEAAYDESGIVVSLLGSGTKRTVVSEAGELEEIAPPPVERKADPEMYVGEKVVEVLGQPARAVQVERTVYARGEVLREETWSTTYRSEPKVVRVGTKPVPLPEPPPAPPETKKDKDEEELPVEPPPPPPGEEDGGGDGG